MMVMSLAGAAPLGCGCGGRCPSCRGLGGPFGDIVPGVADVDALSAALTQVDPVTYHAAQQLAGIGQDMIDRAIRGAGDKNWILPGLPGKTAREIVWWKMRWHATASNVPGISPDASYPFRDDLKKWVVQAAVELNAVAEGGGNVDPGSFSNTWERIKAISTEVEQRVNDLQAQADATAAVGRQAIQSIQADVTDAVAAVQGIQKTAEEAVKTLPSKSTFAIAAVAGFLGLTLIGVTTYFVVKGGRRRGR